MNGRSRVFLGRILISAGLAMVAGCQNEKAFAPTSPSQKVSVGGERGAISGPLAVDVDNYRGLVSIEVVPELAAVEVSAIASEGRESGGTAPFIGADRVSSPGGEILRVICSNAGSEGVAGRDVYIRVPRCDGLRVRNSGGNVVARGVSGAIEIESSQGRTGDVRVETNSALTAPVNIRTTGGNVVLAIGRASTGVLDLRATGGEVSLDVPASVITGGRLRSDSVTGTLNKGTNPFVVTTGAGNISFSTRKY